MLFQWPLPWQEVMTRREFAAIADWFIFFFFWTGAIGIIVIGIAAGADQGVAAGLRIFVLSSLFAAASAVSGWLLGLLFGIPRTLARANVPPRGPPQRAKQRRRRRAGERAASTPTLRISRIG